ncbi:MAG: hypothetical protein ACMVO5_08870 [Polymorphobacter sp.]|uniref:hypothetical protein n=1 Tax=Polymorphobacter sp. TaxID=1909290 RepID=UPI003A84DCC3
MRPLVLALALMVAAPVNAAAEDAFRAGQWREAVNQGRAEATAQSLIYAGRANLWLAGYETSEKARAKALVEAAEKDFDAALALTPNDPEARLQKAVAVGYRAKLAQSPGLAKECRAMFEAVRDAHPDNALAWSAVAGWHGGSVASLGGFMAGMVLGAKTSEFEKGYERVFALEPRNPAYRTLYALTLLDLGPRNAAKAAAALKGIERLPAADAFERKLREQGAALAKVLESGDAKAAQDLARQLAAFGKLA